MQKSKAPLLKQGSNKMAAAPFLEVSGDGFVFGQGVTTYSDVQQPSTFSTVGGQED